MKRNKIIKKIMSFLVLICCLAGSFTWSTVFASEPEGEAAEKNRVVFINEKEKIPYLYVSKEVRDANGKPLTEEAKEDEFYFYLKLSKNGQALDAAEDMEYYVYDVSDKEHKNPLPNPETGGRTDRFQTKTGGEFTLKHGQVARFKLRNGWKYEVEEASRTGYERKTGDKDGKVGGEMADEAQTVAYINEYRSSPLVEGDPLLKVKKEMNFLKGYTPPETPKFVFQIQVKTGSEFVPYQGSYRVERTGTSGGTAQVVEERTTTQNGMFTLRADEECEAIFDSLPRNAVYQVRELTAQEVADLVETEWKEWKKKYDRLPSWESLSQSTEADVPETVPVDSSTGDGDAGTTAAEPPEGVVFTYQELREWVIRRDWENWWPKSEEADYISREGSTMAGETESFENSNASFAVSKTLKDAATNQPFTFQLFDGDGKEWGGVKYYVHSLNSSNRVSSEYQWTDAEGKFQLQAGQIAIFVGIPQGTAYKVTEVVDRTSPYRPTDPESGIREGTVTYNPQTKNFTNGPAPMGLSVSKTVVSDSGERPRTEETDRFKFRLLRKITAQQGGGNSGETRMNQYEPVADEPYSIGKGSGTTGRESEAGIFYLTANQEAVFKNLPAGDYRVEEIIDSTMTNAVEYDFKQLIITKNGTTEDPIEQRSGDVTMSDSTEASLEFQNNYTPYKLNLELKKVGPAEEGDAEAQPLSGAEFKLYRNSELTDAVQIPVSADTGTTPPAEGQTPEMTDVITTGADGMVQIPGIKPGDYWLVETKSPSGYALLADPIKISISRTGRNPQVSINDTPRENGSASNDKIVPRITIACGGDGKNQPDTVQITVCNNELYQLPNAGGIGIYWYSIGGTLLIMAAALILYKCKMRGEGMRN